MLSKPLVDKMNDQINLEFFSSNLYLQMSAWADFKGYEGVADFLKEHADEEMMHMSKLFGYVSETGSLPVIGQIDSPEADYSSLEALFEKIYEHEKLVTKSINGLVEVAFSEKDFSTFQFLQWYVAEQHEEEHLFSSILDKIKLIGTEGKGLYFLDKEIGAMTKGGTGANSTPPA